MLQEEILKQTKGGFNFTATFLTSIVRGINVFADLGRVLGTAIRRIQTGNLC